MIRKIAIFIWIGAIFSALFFYFVRPDLFSPHAIASALTEFQNEALVCFLIVSAIRGFTLLPSTPLILAGTLLFPDQPWKVLAISIAGIMVSSSMIYWFSELLGISDYFERRKSDAVVRIRHRLEQPAGFVFVLLWAFFPLVPTDAVCCVAGSIRMNFLKFIAAIFAGEMILCSIYIFGGGNLIKNILGAY